MRKTVMCLAFAAAAATTLGAQAQVQVLAGNTPARDSVAAAPDGAPPAPAARAWFGSELRFRQWPLATGDWAGTRTRLADHGIEFSANYTHDASANLRGGVRRGSAARGLLVGELSLDLAKLLRIRGATAFASYARLRGSNGSDIVGDIQAFSNIDAEPFSRTLEAWVEQVAASGVIRVKAGRVDANSEFAAVEPAADFMNASAGVSPSILGLPTYPEPKLSANLFVRAASWLTVSSGLYAGTLDPASDGDVVVRDRFAIGQATAAWNGIGPFGAGKLGVGRWHHSGMTSRLDGGTSRGADGMWVTLEQRLGGTDATDDRPARGLQFFAKYGSAPAMLSVFHEHIMAGVVLDGGLRQGVEDALGLAVTHVNLSNVAAAGTPLNETSVELFYKVSVLGCATLRPNVQYVVHPSGDPARANALVATVRTAIAF